MRRAGDVCFAQVFRDGSGMPIQFVSSLLLHIRELQLNVPGPVS